MDVMKKSLPMWLLTQITDTYPNIFEQLDRFRNDESLRDFWPHGQLFVPVAATVSLFNQLQGMTDVKRYQDLQSVAALAGWRQQKNIYTMDEGLAAELYDSALGDTLVNQLKLLAWSMYVQPKSGELLPGIGNKLDGFFAYWDLDKDVYELRFLPLSIQGQQFPVLSLYIPRDGDVTIAEAIADSVAKADDVYSPELLKEYLTHWVRLILFITSERSRCTLDSEHVYKAAEKVVRDVPQEIAYFHVGKA